MKKRHANLSRKFCQLEYDMSGRCRRLACLQKSLYELNTLLKKAGKKQK